jgi:hypothetical protein
VRGESSPAAVLLYGRGEAVAAGVMYVCVGSWTYMVSIFDAGAGTGEKGLGCASRLLVKWPMNDETMHLDVSNTYRTRSPELGNSKLTPIASTHLNGSVQRARRWRITAVRR